MSVDNLKTDEKVFNVNRNEERELKINLNSELGSVN